MKNSNYTQGEWTIEDFISSKEEITLFLGDGTQQTCTVKGDNAEANAKLISSSPDLLEALIKVKGWLTVFEEIAPEIHAKYGNIDVEIGIEKAINKATDSHANSLK